MKKIYLIIVLLLMVDVQAQVLNIPQPLKSYLLGNYPSPIGAYVSTSYSYPFNGTSNYIDTNHDGEIQQSEADLVQYLKIYSFFQSASFAGLEQFINLKHLDCQADISIFNVADLPPSLKKIEFYHMHTTSFTNVDLTGLTNLEYFSVKDCLSVQSINFNGLTHLKDVRLTFYDGLGTLNSLNFNGLNQLENLVVAGSGVLSTIDFSQMPNLKKIILSDLGLTTLDLTPLASLENLELSSLLITNIIHSGLPSLKTLIFSFNNHVVTLNLQGMSNIEDIRCTGNALLTTLLLDVNGHPSLTNLKCSSNAITSIMMNSNGFPSLTDLNCSYNAITSITVNGNGFPSLVNMDCGVNQLSSLHLDRFPALKTLKCNNNLLSSLDVTQSANLQQLYCTNNQMNNLNVAGMTALSYIYCGYNQLTSLNGPLPHLYYLDCGYNQLSTLDLRDSRGLNTIYCHYNQLMSLYLKNNVYEQSIVFFHNPNLQYICADTNQLTDVQSLVNSAGLTNCAVVDDCFQLANDQFEIDDFFVIAPNPVENLLNIEVKNSVLISSVGIYNVLGQLVFMTTDQGGSKSLDVSGLKSGQYFIKIISDQGTVRKRFVKQ